MMYQVGDTVRIKSLEVIKKTHPGMVRSLARYAEVNGVVKEADEMQFSGIVFYVVDYGQLGHKLLMEDCIEGGIEEGEETDMTVAILSEQMKVVASYVDAFFKASQMVGKVLNRVPYTVIKAYKGLYEVSIGEHVQGTIAVVIRDRIQGAVIASKQFNYLYSSSTMVEINEFLEQGGVI